MMHCVPIVSSLIRQLSCATSVVKIWAMCRRLLMVWRGFLTH